MKIFSIFEYLLFANLVIFISEKRLNVRNKALVQNRGFFLFQEFYFFHDFPFLLIIVFFHKKRDSKQIKDQPKPETPESKDIKPAQAPFSQIRIVPTEQKKKKITNKDTFFSFLDLIVIICFTFWAQFFVFILNKVSHFLSSL